MTLDLSLRVAQGPVEVLVAALVPVVSGLVVALPAASPSATARRFDTPTPAAGLPGSLTSM
jgi:hypothetical protein